MRKKFNVFLTLLLALTVQITFAQEKSISGVVTDAADGSPMPGVNVIVKGTDKGASTDFDGKYSIKANVGDVLVFSYTGYGEIKKTIASSNTINVAMKAGNTLDDVLIVGYNKTNKKAFTGTAILVKQKDIKRKNVSNISKALAGEAPGVTVINSSGQPGTSATIRIRGFGSVNGNRAPLYVVDGVPFDGAINTINPADMKSVVILKDATATAIYGSRGANGVILIQTKSGSRNTSSIEVNLKSGTNFSFIPRYDVMKDPNTYIETAWNAQKNSGEKNGVPDPIAFANDNLFSGTSSIDPKYNLWQGVTTGADLIDPATGKVKNSVTRKYNPENWENEAFQSAIRNEANVIMRGGSDKSRYYTSIGYLNDQGYIINSSFDRLNTRLNLSFEPVKRIEIKANIGYAYTDQISNGQSSDSGSIFWFVDNLPSIYPLYLRDNNGDKIPDPIYGGYQYDYGVGRGFGAFTNAIADATYDLNQTKRHSLNGNFSFNLTILKDLIFETKYGIQYSSSVGNVINNPFYGSAAGQGGSLYKTYSGMVSQNLLNLLRYKIEKGKHGVNFIVAHEANQWQRERSAISKSKAVNMVHGLDQVTNYVNTSSPASGYLAETALESYFGQVNYNFDQKYFFSASLRRDGSSRFAKNKWGTFGSAGLSWVVSKEDFFKVKAVNYLKAKISYGVLGDEAGVNFYAGVNGYNINVLDGNISLVRRASANEDITWETSRMFQTGLEFGLFKNKIEGTLDLYNKNTTNLIFNRRIPISSGDAIMQVNDGELRNRGVEFALTTHIIENKKFKFDFIVNGEFLKNTLTAMPIDPSTGKPKLLDIAGLYGRSEGRSLYDFYMKEWAGVDDSNGDPLWTMYYEDLNSNGMYDSGEEVASLTEYEAANPNATIEKTTTNDYSVATLKYIDKSAIPVLRGAFRVNLGYDKFDFGAQFLYSLGGYSYDGAYSRLMSNDQIGGNNYHNDILNAWTKPGDKTDIPKHYSNENINANGTSSRFITKSDFLMLNNVRLGYTFKKDIFKGVKKLNIWVTGDNLMLMSSRNGFNPTTSETGGSSMYRYSPLTTISLGLNVKL